MYYYREDDIDKHVTNLSTLGITFRQWQKEDRNSYTLIPTRLRKLVKIK